MKYIADTNVISELMKEKISPNVGEWFWDNEGDIFITAITVKELYQGAMLLPNGKRRERLLQAIEAIVVDCADKTFPLDSYSAFLSARFNEIAINKGRTPTAEDMMIAGICQRNDAILATRNVKDFDYLGIELVNPFEYQA